MKNLSELIKHLPNKRVIGNPEISIHGIAYDSRQVGKDFLFAAIRGQHLDGSRFIHEAIKRGATAIIAEDATPSVSVAQIVVPDVREAMSKLAASFYGEPCNNMTLIGVTGTNGKTTTTYLAESILKAAGFYVGVVGTINYRYGDKIFNAPHTTPESPDLQKIFKEMVDSDVTHCVMEVSSHSLSQKRVDGSIFAGGVFTNLTQDHLDYHRTMEEYFESKARLFTDFTPRFAVINVDDAWGKRLAERMRNAECGVGAHGRAPLRNRILTYSLHHKAEIHPAKVSFSEKGIEAMLDTPIGSVKISSPLLGEYNLQNSMAAVGVGVGLGLDKQAIEQGITNLKRVPGRLERIISDDGLQAVVDYAHTGDALERVLNTLRPLTKGRLITVFGCGGDRDRGKRPIMGEIATRLSDFTIITSDNPRNEEPLEIIKEIEAGIDKGSRDVYTVMPDRHEAIKVAADMAAGRDIILVAGKGHEDYQIIGSAKIHFDDTEEIKKAMEERNQEKKTGTK